MKIHPWIFIRSLRRGDTPRSAPQMPGRKPAIRAGASCPAVAPTDNAAALFVRS